MFILGVLLVSATYFYFLIFAQFAFLEVVKSNLGLNPITLVMSVMGLSGMVGSLVSAKLLRKFGLFSLLQAGVFLCAITGFLSVFVTSIRSLVFVSLLIGLGLSALTVSLASGIPMFFSKKNLGTSVGFGTGSAYFICNIPLVFTANPRMQGLMVGVVLVIMLAILRMNRGFFIELCDGEKEKSGFDLREHKFLILFLVTFLALVWFDSSAFYVIQTAGELKSATWNNDLQLWRNALIHFFSALIAGKLIDNGRIRDVLVLSFLFLALGVFYVQWMQEQSFMAAPFYCSGVSFYSTALVAFPSLFAERLTISRVWLSGLLYAISGWFGSAMGIGMAQDLKRVPALFILISGVTLVSSYINLRKIT